MSDNYHHGDLRRSLIEEGIKIINKVGEDGLSLRKLASACGVSYAAPYSHFKNKDELLNAIKEYVSEKFYDFLIEAKTKAEPDGTDGQILAIGKAYIIFFIRNPEYFSFLFSRGYICVNLDYSSSESSNFKAFNILKELVTKYVKENNVEISEEELELQVIRRWVSVQGITSLVFMENVTWNKRWEDQLEKLLI